MDVELNPSGDFLRTVARLKGAPPQIKKRLSAEVKSATAPIEKQMKQNILSVQSKGRRGGGGSNRGAYNASQSKRGNQGKTGLRQAIAKGVTRKITYSGYRTGVRIRVDGKYLPEGDRSLIKATNKGQVRHPVFGNRTNWTSQTFTPSGWFDRPAQEMGEEAIRKIEHAARNALRDLEK